MLAIVTDHTSWGGVDVLTQRFAEFLRAKNVAFSLVVDGSSRLQIEAPWAPVMTSAELVQGCRDRSVSSIYFPTASMLRRQDLPWRELGQARVFTLLVQPYEPVTRFVPALTFATERIGFSAVNLAKLIIPAHFGRVAALFRHLASASALGVMDGASARALQHFFPGIADTPLLPIPAPTAQLRPEHKPLQAGTMAFGYLGRLDALKWSALKPVVVHELAALSGQGAVELHAVAEGACMAELAAECKRAGVNLHAYGYLPNTAARKLLAEKANVGLAMGTSALDLAGAGLPCIVIDAAARLHAPNQRLFHFVHEARAFTLGDYRDFAAYEQHGRPFAACIAMAEGPAVQAAEHAYVRDQHAPDICFQATLDAIQGSQMTGEALATHVDAIEASFTRMGRWYRWAGTGGQFRLAKRASAPNAIS